MASTASMDPSLNFAVISGGGARAFRPKSSHLSTWGRGTFNAFVTLRATSRPPEMYAAPMIASATSATVYVIAHIRQENRVEERHEPCLLNLGLRLAYFAVFAWRDVLDEFFRYQMLDLPCL